MFANLGGASDDGVTSRRGSTGPAAGEGGGASPPRRPLTTHALEMEIQRVQAYTDGELETVREDVTDLQVDVSDVRCLVMKLQHQLHQLHQLQQHHQQQQHRQLQQKQDELHQQLQQLEELHQQLQQQHSQLQQQQQELQQQQQRPQLQRQRRFTLDGEPAEVDWRLAQLQ